MKLHKRFMAAVVASGLSLTAGCQNPCGSCTRSLCGSPSVPQVAPHPAHLPEVAVRVPADIGAQTCMGVAEVLEHSGDLGGAKSQYVQALRLEPGNVDAAHRLAVIHDRLREYGRAEALYRRVARATPQDPNLYSNWGYSHYLQGNWEASARYSLRALEMAPTHPTARSNYAMALGQMGRFEEARQTFVEAGLSPADLACSMAYLHWSAGNLDRARNELLYAAGPVQHDARVVKMLNHLESNLALTHRLHSPRPVVPPVTTAAQVETVVVPPPQIQTGEPNTRRVPLPQPTTPARPLERIPAPAPEKEVVPTSLPTPSTSFKPDDDSQTGKSTAFLAAQTPPPVAWPRTGHILPPSPTNLTAADGTRAIETESSPATPRSAAKDTERRGRW